MDYRTRLFLDFEGEENCGKTDVALGMARNERGWNGGKTFFYLIRRDQERYREITNEKNRSDYQTF